MSAQMMPQQPPYINARRPAGNMNATNNSNGNSNYNNYSNSSHNNNGENNNNNNNNNNSNQTARLFVGQLNFEATEYDVQQIFSFYGYVLHVNILRNEGKSTGSAFVTYSSTADADNAILALHERFNMGREKPLQVSYCRRSDSISDFGYQHMIELQRNNKSNPLPPQRD